MINGSFPDWGQLKTSLPQSVPCASSCRGACCGPRPPAPGGFQPQVPAAAAGPGRARGGRPGLPVWARGGRIALPVEAAAAAAPAVRWWGFSARRREAGRPRLPVGGRARIRASECVRVRECVSVARRVSGRGSRLLPCRRCSRWKSM